MQLLLINLLVLPLLIQGAALQQKPEQRQPSPSTDQQAAAMLRYLSPYLIELFIDVNEEVDLKQIWRMLKLDVSGDVPARCSDCSAETFELNIRGDGKTVALRISFEGGEFYQYLIFKKVKFESTEKWKFLGSFDCRGQKAGPPAHRIESGDSRTWLVIREQRNQTPSMKVQSDVWYEIKETEVRRVLAYRVEGSNAPCESQLGRSYKSILLRHELENRVYTVPVQLLISYNMSDCNKGRQSPVLFAKAQKAYHIWDSEKEQFILDESRSDITEKEMNEVYSAERLSGDSFIAYNFRELSELAKAGDAKQKNWLRNFLTTVKDSQQKLALQQALAQ